MKGSFEQAASDLLSGENGKKINARKNDIQRIADSSDGKKVKEMLDQNFDLEGALARGDIGSRQVGHRNNYEHRRRCAACQKPWRYFEIGL